MDEKDIDGWRVRINELDAQILKLLQQRAECSHNIGSIKKALGRPVFVPEREQQVLDRLVELNAGVLPDNTVRAIFSTVMAESRAIQNDLKD